MLADFQQKPVEPRPAFSFAAQRQTTQSGLSLAFACATLHLVKLERTIVAAAVLLFLGLGVLLTNFKGTTGFSTGFPLSQSLLQITGQSSGVPALLAPVLILIGLVLLLVCTFTAFFNILDSRK